MNTLTVGEAFWLGVVVGAAGFALIFIMVNWRFL